MRGGMGYSAQGTGITSGMDTPRPRYYGGGTIGGGTIMGNMMGNRTGFEEPELKSIPEQREDLTVQEQEIVKTPRGTNMYDVISSFGTYANMKNPDGSYKTTGEAGFEQAESISKIRKDRKDLQDAQKLKAIEDKRKVLDTEDKFTKDKELVTLEKTLDKDLKIAVEQAKGNNLDVIRRIKILDERLASNKITQAQYDDMTNALLSKSDTMLEQVNAIAQALITANVKPPINTVPSAPCINFLFKISAAFLLLLSLSNFSLSIGGIKPKPSVKLGLSSSPVIVLPIPYLTGKPQNPIFCAMLDAYFILPN